MARVPHSPTPGEGKKQVGVGGTFPSKPEHMSVAWWPCLPLGMGSRFILSGLKLRILQNLIFPMYFCVCMCIVPEQTPHYVHGGRRTISRVSFLSSAVGAVTTKDTASALVIHSCHRGVALLESPHQPTASLLRLHSTFYLCTLWKVPCPKPS